MHAQDTTRPSYAASAELTDSKQAMSRVAFLIGEWEGDGWIVMGPDPQITFRKTEIVISAANNTAILHQGAGSERDSVSGQWNVVFQAMSQDGGTKWLQFFFMELRKK